MSAEQFIIAEVVREGSPRKVFQHGLSAEDFELFDQEFAWVVEQYEKRRPITAEDFKRKFPDFELIQSPERVEDLIESFQRERAYVSISSALDQIGSTLDFDNALEKAEELKEILREVIKTRGAVSDVSLHDWKKHFNYMRHLMLMRENGEAPGIPTGLPTLDFHLGGLQKGRLYLVLGRPGDGKSYFLAKLAVEAMLDGKRVGFFSPEMSEHEHRARIYTLLSANLEIQEQVGLAHSFRNRALMDGTGYNLMTYKRFLAHVHSNLKGNIEIYTSRFRRRPTVGTIEGWVEQREIDLLIVDPIYELKPPRRGTKFEELGEIVDAIEEISQFFDIPVVITNQANRALVGGKGDIPSKDTSYGSDVPVQRAGIVLGVKYEEDDEILRLRCSKSRFGKAFRLQVKLNPNTGYMEELVPELQGAITPEEARALLTKMEEDSE